MLHNFGGYHNAIVRALLWAALAGGLAVLCGTPNPACAAPVTWSFVETGCTLQDGTSCSPTAPIDLIDLTLPDVTSSGSATWSGINTIPTYSGDTFTLNLADGATLTPAFPGGAFNCMRSVDPSAWCFFFISWQEMAGQLDSISLDLLVRNGETNILDAIGFGVPFGLTGGTIASQGSFGNCPSNAACVVTGTWQETPVPEPDMTVTLAAVSLVLFWHCARRRSADSKACARLMGRRGVLSGSGPVSASSRKTISIRINSQTDTHPTGSYQDHRLNRAASMRSPYMKGARGAA